jgi:transcriptional regulator with XRE-family HTH domain
MRRKAGMTLQALADQAGISVGFLSQVERDKATPSLGTLASLAAALGVEIDWFIATPRPPTASPARGTPALFHRRQLAAYERLTPPCPAARCRR